MMPLPHRDPTVPRTLLEAAAASDPAATEAVARQLWPQVRRWALLELGDAVRADDVAQEALVRLLKHLPTLDLSQPVEGWVRTVVRRTCHDLRRGEARRARVPEPVRQHTLELERQTDLRKGARAAIDAFASLSPRQREALEWVDRRGHSPQEAAARMGITPATVRALLHQGRRALRRSLLDLADLVEGK